MSKTITVTRLRLQPTPSASIIADLYWRYPFGSNTLFANNVVVDTDGYLTGSPPPAVAGLDNINNQYVIIEAVSAECGSVAEQYFLLQTNISCPEGFALSDDETYCYMIETIPATPPTAAENTIAKTNVSYTTCGSYIYSAGYNLNGTGTSAQITTANTFWANGAGLCANNTTIDGVLNRCGLWATTTSNNQTVGFAICIDIPTTKTYYIGMGCDNYGTLRIDGEDVIVQNVAALDIQYPMAGANSSTFKIWHIYPVTMQAGIHYIEIIGTNVTSVAAFGAEIYDNTSAELIAATGYGDLELIFSTKDYVGSQVELGSDGIGYTCPDGYALVTCGSPFVCKRIITVPPIIG